MNFRIAFSGASGTGKSTLAKYISEFLDIPQNPVGSREVAKAMGFESPYDVDRAGRREEFQRRLVLEKIGWETMHEDFVTDRTTMDNLAYTALHAVDSVDEDFMKGCVLGLRRYSHVFYCPIHAFQNLSDDPARKKSASYHEIYATLLFGLLTGRVGECRRIHVVTMAGREDRKDFVRRHLVDVR